MLTDVNNLEEILDIEELTESVEEINISIDSLIQQEVNLETFEKIAIASNEDNALTMSTINMLTQSLESSVASLGLPLSILDKVDYQDDPKRSLIPTLEAKENFVNKIKIAIKKLIIKLNAFVRKTFLKIMTTVNFNKKKLNKIKEELNNLKGFSFSKETKFIYDVDLRTVRYFQTLFFLARDSEVVSFLDIEESILTILNADKKTTLLSRVARAYKNENKTYLDRMAAIRESMSKENDRMFNQRYGFKRRENLINHTTITKEDLELLKKSNNIELLRIDGNVIKIFLISDETIGKKLISFETKILPNALSIPNPKELINVVDQALKATANMKEFIDGSFNYIKTINDYIDKLIKDEVDTKTIDRYREEYRLAPDIAMQEVLGRYRTIQNVIGFTNAIISKAKEQE